MEQKQKTYAPGFFKTKKWPDGNESFTYQFDAQRMLDFISQHTNSRGGISLNITKRREVGKYNETHSVSLDTWEPKAKGEQPAGSTNSDNIGAQSMPF